MSEKKHLKGLMSAETESFIQSLNEKPFRAKQIRQWMFERLVSDFSEMTNLSKTFRERLASTANITELEEANRKVSSDGSIKFLFRLHDGKTIESVWMPEETRATLCVSTQVGCKLACGFCMTGEAGFERQLSAAEIVDQLIQVRKLVHGGRVTNIVFMGMGEPLDNYDNVLQALKVLTEPDCGLIGARKITVSTAGVVPGILRLAKDFSKIKLAVSLNSADDATRNKLMPINKKHPISELFWALKKWPLPKGRLLTLEYVLIAGVNDSDDDAKKLAKLCSGMPVKINLIPYNSASGAQYKSPSKKRVDTFMKIVSGRGLIVIPRASRGQDIMAACGQLRGKAS
ncbi:23S rRNA (adenine(2503)-C(2))-methyltransferase @ tRNA (adenine(37)-C(2))-methyltransferase [hydrothermal vent metagenome]|uniref:23S rRNA (Adenine(2503)-C(2))-methyltransferase @ tRNA (Adenine(37)-C(2))-methyltransferase n=1 Tax=hydrothermal vent metagenome TaxID=652676 RepID=A0A3B1BJN1_9ZZZZ